MPLIYRIPLVGDFVVTGHRGAASSVLPKQAKDACPYADRPPEQRPPRKHASRPPRLPSIRVQRLSDATMFGSPSRLLAAASEIRPTRTSTDLLQAVAGRVKAGLDAAMDFARTPLFVVGGNHLCCASLMTTIAVIGTAKAHAHAHAPILLLELPRDVLELLDASMPPIFEELTQAMNRPAPERCGLVKDMLGKRYDLPLTSNHPVILLLLARWAGIRVDAFDPVGFEGAKDMVHRESLMAEAIERHVLAAGKQPVIVSTGANHVGQLCNGMRATANVNALSTIPAGVNGSAFDPFARTRASELHAMAERDEVWLIRPTQSLSTSPFDFVSFAEASGMLD